MDVLLEVAIRYGIFAVLFVWLLHTTNKRNEKREEMYQATINKNQEIISAQAKAYGSLAGDVNDIKILLKKVAFGRIKHECD